MADLIRWEAFLVFGLVLTLLVAEIVALRRGRRRDRKGGEDRGERPG